MMAVGRPIVSALQPYGYIMSNLEFTVINVGLCLPHRTISFQDIITSNIGQDEYWDQLW
jgi:hypothetical protein